MKQSVCVLIKKDNLFLGVAKRDNHKDFGLPGGKVEPQEQLTHAACRELLEETGVVAAPENLIPVFNRQDDEFQCTTFLCTNWYGEPKQGDAGPVKWLTEHELTGGTFGEYNLRLFKEMNDEINIQILLKKNYGTPINE